MADLRLHDWFSAAAAQARRTTAAARLRAEQSSSAVRGRLRAGLSAGGPALLRQRLRWPAVSQSRDAGDGASGEWRTELSRHGLVLTWVASALVVRYLLGAAELAGTLLFYPVVVALAGWRGGWTSGLVAMLGSVLAIRLTGVSDARLSVLFGLESVVLLGLVTAWSARLSDRTQTLDAANHRLGVLQAADQRARTLDAAVRSLEAQASEYAIVLLDRQGFITEWRDGARAVYRVPANEALGHSADGLFAQGEGDAGLRALMAEAQRGTVVRRTAWQRRGDGTVFEAEIELAMTVALGGDGFAMVVRDRTFEYERQARATAALDAQRALRDEADVAQQQLAALQSVTDPSLNAWAPSHLVAELLERVRDAVHADGIALVLMRGGAPRVFSTPEGMHPDGLADRPLPELSGQATARITLVQNDPARVFEQSLLRWPSETASLIAVPVVHAGEIEGTIEVVDRRGRRSTEWEIALLQVVAARVAGLARDHGYADSAVA